MGHYFKTPDQALAILGFTDYKSLDQERAIKAVLKGNDLLAVMPTGGGKSLCFMAPTIAKGWLTIVISPLVALIDDQVQKLRKRGVRAYALHGGITAAEKRKVIYAAREHGDMPMFIYTTPESALTNWFREYFGGSLVDLLAFDEAHCVSVWGESFRPDYLRTAEIARRLEVKQVAAFSATLDRKMVADVKYRIPLGKCGSGLVEIYGDPYRRNLQYRLETPGNDQTTKVGRFRVAMKRLGTLLRQEDEFYGPTLVYGYTRQGVGDLMKYMAPGLSHDLGMTPILYHAGMTEDDKRYGLEQFQNARHPVVFCTTAFGMGIDRSNVRRVVHFDVPDNLVDLAQQSGRAGRDDNQAECVSFYQPHRLDLLESKVKFDIPQASFVEAIYNRLKKEWLGLPKDERPTFSLTAFQMRQHHQRIAAGEDEKRSRLFEQSVTRAIIALRQARVIVDDDGFHLRSMRPGNPAYLRMLEHTQMAERRQVREAKRVKEFFSSHEEGRLDQHRLWELIQQED